MAARLLVLAHGPTRGQRELIFGDRSPLEGAGPFEAPAGRSDRWVCGPEPACAETVRRLGGEPLVLNALRGPDPGAWRGRTLTEIAAADPDGLRAWLSSPDARPHGGETLAELIIRVGAVADGEPWPEGRTVVVVAPLAARALIVHGLRAAPEVIFGVDFRPLGRAELTRGDRRWRLRPG